MSAPAPRGVRLGAGAGYSGDRIEPAVELAERAEIDYLIFECLAERTIALAQQERQRDPARGFDPFLEARMRAVLPACRRRGIRIVTNSGAANPIAAAALVRDIAASLGLKGLRVAAVLGDDVLASRPRRCAPRTRAGEPFAPPSDVLSANVYLGAEPIVEALAGGADVVITGRVADSSLFLAPVVHELGWRFDDWTRLARGAIAGHLLECAGQVTGGYFADPGYKDVERARAARLSDRRDHGRRIDRDHEAPGHRRVRDGADVHRAAAVRGARPVGVRDAGRHGRHHWRDRRGGGSRTACASSAWRDASGRARSRSRWAIATATWARDRSRTPDRARWRGRGSRSTWWPSDCGAPASRTRSCGSTWWG